MSERPDLARVMHYTRDLLPNDHGWTLCGTPGSRPNVTIHIEEVTCQRCRKMLGEPVRAFLDSARP